MEINNIFGEIVGQPLVVNHGLGQDSMAMLILLDYMGIRPDRINFGDTGGEFPETYAYIKTVNHWCRKVGFPELIVTKKISPLYSTLEENMIRNKTLPGAVFRKYNCSEKWKYVSSIDKGIKAWEPARKAWASGIPVIKAVGYNAGGNRFGDARRYQKALKCDLKRSEVAKQNGTFEKYLYWYPLAEKGITRDKVVELIEQAGLPVPRKSACFFCPSTKKQELPVMAKDHPSLLARALKMEAVSSHNWQKIKGLGGDWNWLEFMEIEYPELLADIEQKFDVGRSDYEYYRNGGEAWPGGITPAVRRKQEAEERRLSNNRNQQTIFDITV